MKLKTVQFIGLFLLMLVTGVFWGTWFALTRSLDAFSNEEFIHIGKVIIANVALPMRIIFPSAILFVLLSLWWYPAKRSAPFYWGTTALVLAIVTLLITLIVLVPIDNQVKSWTVTTLPANADDLRIRWSHFHTLRTFTSLAGFGSFLMFIINTKNQFSEN
jgi:Domain of unknown function (DUF1772)